MRLVDSHCHLDFPAFDADRPAVLEHCRGLGVEAIVVPGVTAAAWPRLAAVVAAAPAVHGAYGLHPCFMAEHGAGDVEALAGWLEQSPAVAVGEIGLDFWEREADRDAQLALFRAQMAVARAADLPLILHVRKAHDRVLAELRRHPHGQGGAVHAFSGSLQQAHQYLEQGFLLGFGGAVTHARARRLRATLAALPDTALLLETDAPDMAPAGHRGERNTPEHLPEILRTVAAVRGEAPEAVAHRTTANAEALFGIRRSAAVPE